jgi:hypothetical protein
VRCIVRAGRDGVPPSQISWVADTATLPTLFSHRITLQQFTNAAFEPRQVERLGEKVIGVQGRHSFSHVAGERAHENNGDFFGGRLPAQNFADGQPVKVGQQNVEQDQVRFELPGLAQRLHTVGGREKFTAQPGQPEFHQLDEVGFVIHD